jgi:thymidylate synthase
MNTPEFVVEETNLSTAWLKTVDLILNGSGKEIAPFVLTLTQFNETEEVRTALDDALKKSNLASIQTVSETIFPDSLYRYCDEDRNELYRVYNDSFPRIRKIDPSNRNGTYFQRLIAFEGRNGPINQLEIIISSLRNPNVKRRSKLQAAIFDPNTDHTNGMFQGFPCLQHVTFALSENGGLILNSFYAIQYLYRRGYGNWLGLINLGRFIANELDIEFEKMICCVGVEQLEINKTQARKILATIEETV